MVRVKLKVLDSARPTPRVLRGLAVAAFAAIASPCLAEVIEIGPDGGTATYAAPAVFTPSGAIPISASSAHVKPIPDLARTIAAAAARQRMSVDLVTEVARRESSFRQAAVSSRGAVGVMQLTAGTARDLGVDRFDTAQNIFGGAAYLRRMLDRYGGDIHLALAAYNAGPGAVDRYRGVPPYPETRTYVAAILAHLPSSALPRFAPSLFTR